MLDLKYYWAVLCYKIHTKIGWKYPYPIDGLMVPKLPKIQNWLASQIPYDSW